MLRRSSMITFSDSLILGGMDPCGVATVNEALEKAPPLLDSGVNHIDGGVGQSFSPFVKVNEGGTSRNTQSFHKKSRMCTAGSSYRIWLTPRY
jgi:hypothetical protein